MAARKCFASLTTVKLLTLEKVITLSGMALTEKDPRIESKNKLIMKSSTQKSCKNTFLSNKHTSFASNTTTFSVMCFLHF